MSKWKTAALSMATILSRLPSNNMWATRADLGRPVTVTSMTAAGAPEVTRNCPDEQNATAQQTMALPAGGVVEGRD
jgi:hypothetical protein